MTCPFHPCHPAHSRGHDFRREQQARHRRRVLQRQARDLGRIEDALFQHVAVLAPRLDGVQEDDAGDHAIFDGVTGRVQRVIHTLRGGLG